MFEILHFPSKSRCVECSKFAAFYMLLKGKKVPICGDCALELAKQITITIEEENN